MKSETIRLAFAGDFFLGGEDYLQYADAQGLDYLAPLRKIEPLFSEVDLGLINFEGPACKTEQLRPNVTTRLFNHPKALEFCKQNNFHVLNLANNHTLDFGEAGLVKTLEMIEDMELAGVGAGRNIEEARRPVIIEVKNRKIAFFACTTPARSVKAVIATADSPGCADYSDLDSLCARVQEVKRLVDVICVVIHWGIEFYQYPDPDQVRVAHALVDAGAHFVIGHHPHFVQGLEVYRDSLIAYSLGHFFFAPERFVTGRLRVEKKLEKEMMLLFAEIDASGKIDFKIVGGRQEKDFTLTPFESHKQESFRAHIDTLSAPVSSGNYDIFWQNYRARRERELERESLYEAFVRLSQMSFREVIDTVSFAHLRGHLGKIYRMISRS